MAETKEVAALSEFKTPGRTRADGPIICPGHNRCVMDLQFSKPTSEGTFLISACQDYKSMVRDAISGDWIGTFIGHKGSVVSARLNDAATRAVTGSTDWTARIWDALSGDQLHEFTHKHSVRAVAFLKGDTGFVTGCQDKRMRLYDLNAPESSPKELLNDGIVTHVAVHPDGNLVYNATDGQAVVKLWDLRSGEVAKTMAAKSPVSYLELSTDGSVLSAAAGKEACFWDTKTQEQVACHSVGRDLTAVTYHPRAKHFVVASGTDVFIHNFESGAETACNKAHHGGVRSLAFAHNGETFASGAEDSTLRIWEFMRDGEGTVTAAPGSEAKSSAT